MSVAVPGHNEVGGFISHHVGHGRRGGEAFHQAPVARPQRDRAVVGGGQQLAVLVEELHALHRTGVRLPTGDFAALWEMPQVDAALGAARGERAGAAVEGKRVSIVVDVLQGDIGRDRRRGTTGQAQPDRQDHQGP